MALWVFGYGSLLWNPGFAVAESRHARLADYARSFCMRSIHHRGTKDAPGLVLALDHHRGAVCDGVAFRARDGAEDDVLAYLRERELVSAAYLEETVALDLDGGQRLEALAYVIDRDHDQYCRISLEEQARIIARATGGRGPNTEYLFNTAAHLEELGIPDAEMQWLVDRVRALQGAAGA